MTAFVGADVDQLDSLASRLDGAAQQLSALVAKSSLSITMAEWTGADIDALRSTWNRQSRPQLLASSTAMATLATALRTQAQQQRDTSGPGGSGAPGLSLPPIELPGWLAPGMLPQLPFDQWSDQDWTDFGERIKASAGNLLTAIDIGKVAMMLRGLGEVGELTSLSKVLGPLGLAFTSSEIVASLQEGDYLGVFRHGLSGGVSLADMLAGSSSTLGPLALGIAAFNGFVDITLPVTGEEQDETIAMGARHMYGENVDMKNLTSEQATGIQKRYDLPAGPLFMISDTMDATAEKIFPWNW